MRAERTIKPAKGDRGECEWLTKFWDTDPLNGGCATPLDVIIDQMTSSVVYKKAFWEIVWTRGRGDFRGKAVYADVAWRPQTTTRSMHHPRSGKIIGFQQEPYVVGPGITPGIYPIEIEGPQQFVHVHGNRRDPINGISDLEVPYWAYKTKQKIMFLLFQFLEGVSLPRVLVKSQNDDTARAVARSIAQARGSGVIPIDTDGQPSNVDVQALDLSGKGADQFMKTITWLDQCATNAVMAGFLDLTSTAVSGGNVGVHLSSDASDFFLMTLESKHREYERSIRSGLFAPIVRHNFGPSAVVPLYQMAPLNSEDKTAAVDMLSNLMRSRDPALVPDEFIQELVRQVSTYLGMDGDKLEKAFTGAAEKARQMSIQAMQAQANATQLGRGQKLLAQQNAGNVAAVAGATGAATRAMAAGKAGKNPVKAAKGRP
jgi:hypothetical protein